MKTLGMIGGLGPLATIDYYRLLIEVYQRQRPDGTAPSILINSLDVNKVLGLATANQLAELTGYLSDAIKRLAAAGADFGLISANLPHIVFDEVRGQSPIPLISIAEAACESAADLRLKRCTILGTRFIMQSTFYPDTFARRGIEILLPNPDEQDYIHDKYVNEVIRGTFSPGTRARLLAIMSDMKTRAGIDGVILAGTEFPLLLRDAPSPGIQMLDTTRIHVERAVRELLS
jgi:aspartate racemase